MVSFNANALLGEVRIFYGNASGEPKDFNNAFYNFQDGPKIGTQAYSGLDAIAMLPVIPLGFGIRYETSSFSKTEFAEQVDYTLARTALVLNYRIVNTGFYVGPIITYGVSNSITFKLPLDPEVYTAGKSNSYSLGLEAGAKLGLFRMGIEVGQLHLVYSDLKDISGVVPNKNGLNINQLDFSSNYYKVLLGIGF